MIETKVETVSTDSHHADNMLSANENTKFSKANKKHGTSAKAPYDVQDSGSIPIAEEKTYIAAAEEYEATKFGQYPFLHHGSLPTRSKITGEFIPGPTAGVAARPAPLQFPTPTSSEIPEQLVIPDPQDPDAAATGPSSKNRTRRASCIFCQELGHGVDNCPFLPCKHCTNMGHIGKNCPTIPRNRKYVANCSSCKKPTHGRKECPSRPCRYCGLMGHVGRACPIMTEKRAERKRKTDAWRQAK